MIRTSLIVCVAVLLFTASTFAATPDIVLYSSDVTAVHGNWTVASDPTAAGGPYLANADNGWATLTSPLSSPADYFEMTFTAPANTVYHAWFRLRASGNSKYNDSIWVQYSDAMSGGTPVYAIGGNTGLNVNLEACSGCGDSGWGWQAGAYWLSEATTIQFATTGSHTIRVQPREDGVQIDQIVLSASTYLSSAPGQVENDSTIVPKPSTTSTATATTSTASSSSTPFLGSPAAIPGTIKPENYDNGGAGVAYYDTTSGNAGGAYRSDDVDIEPASGGGYDVGWVAAGEWLRYTVNVAAAGSYTVAFSVASNGQGGTFHLEMNGTNVTGSLSVPNTGGWQAWTTITATASLAAGTQVARLVMDAAGANAVGNFGPIQFAAATSTSTSSGQAAAFLGGAVALPGRVEAENFDNGGSGVAYYDTTAGNAGGAYRSTDVDIEPSSEGGYDVGWIAAGEWLNYSVTAAAAGAYTAQLRVASPGGGSLHIGFNGPSNVWTTVTVPATGGWQTWTTVTVPVTLGAGSQLMTLLFDTGGFNVDYVDIGSGGVPSTTTGASSTTSSGPTITVAAGGDLQAAINSAQPGDTILLAPGATYAGTFVLPANGGSSYITIRSGAPNSSLPSAGTRVSPAYASQLARIQGGTAGMPAFVTALGAHHYQLQFLEIVSTYANNDIVQLGDGSSNQSTLGTVAHDLIIDRCYIHGDPTNGQKRGIALNSASTTITGSYISDIKSAMGDAQAIDGWNGPGPFTITNNYLEASGENIMFGGADPSVPNLVPSDITIQHNYVTKPVVWRSQGWIVKNLIELKNAQRVIIDSNVVENNWAAAQQGYSILMTPRDQNGSAPWTVVQQVQITNNVVRHVSSVFNILGYDNTDPSQLTNGITIRNNLFYDVSAANWGGNARFLLTDGGNNITVDHNTLFSDGTSDLYLDGPAVTGFAFTNNIVPDNAWAIMGTGSSPGNGSIAAYLPGATFARNVFIAGNSSTYPANNFYPPDAATVQFNADDSLAASSPYIAAATDGTAIGANVKAVLAGVPPQ